MKYFQLLDDVHVPSRWHLGCIRLADGAELSLLGGKPLTLLGRASVDVATAGRPPEFCTTSFAAPVASQRLGQAIAEVAGSDLQLIPLLVGESKRYVGLNATRTIACVDESRSRFLKWLETDHRSDKAGSYRSITELHVEARAVPPDAHFFRVHRWCVGLIVSETVRVAMEQCGCLGAKFIDVT